MKNRYVVIMAGGKGERFWPQSRLKRPKHLLPIVGNSPMLSQTIERLEGLVPPERIFVSPTQSKGSSFGKLSGSVAGGSSRNRKVGYGCGGWLGCLACGEGRRECGFALLPADHVIEDAKAFGPPRGGFCCVGS